MARALLYIPSVRITPLQPAAVPKLAPSLALKSGRWLVTGILAELATSAAARIVGSLVAKRRSGAGSFQSALLEAQKAAGHAEAAHRRISAAATERAKIARLAQRLAALPVTCDEANRIAGNLWALVEDLKLSAGREGFEQYARGALTDFVERASRALMLSGEDRAQFARTARGYVDKELSGAVGLNRTKT